MSTEGQACANTLRPLPTYNRADFASEQTVRWCPGCGDYAILATMQRIMPSLCEKWQLPRENVVFISGIGCSSRFPYYMNTYGFHSIHGRAPTLATGVKIARPELKVWVVTGDGDGLSIGGNHLIHALRRNLDIKIILFNNRIYGLTKGQYSPTSEFGKKTKSSPVGTVEQPIHPVSIALAAEATFVARTIDRDVQHLQHILERAGEHRGSAFVEVYQNCNIFNDGAFKYLADSSVRKEKTLYIEHGKPLVFGENRDKGIRVRRTRPRVVTLGEVASESDLFKHNEKEEVPTLAYMLAHMGEPEFPVPVGVFRCVERPTYEDNLYAQLEEAKANKGVGDIDKLLNSGDVWTID